MRAVLFSSLEFLLLFLPLTLAVALRLRGQPLLRWIALTSVIFYAFAGHWWFIVPMLVTTVVDYWVAIAIERARGPRARAWLLGLSLAGNLGMLAYFKYSGLMVHTVEQGLVLLGVEDRAGFFRWFEVILPAGISFYTFQTLSYIVDVWRGQRAGRAQLHPVRRLRQLLSAPDRGAARPPPPADPAARANRGDRDQPAVARGVAAVQRRALQEGPDRGPPRRPHRPACSGVRRSWIWCGAWLVLLGYSFQIYFDFSGYSDMAIGLGRLFGIELPQNFNSPYKAASPSDFWRRWHMTLSFWLRDYLYIPLGGNRCTPGRRRFNLMATMVLGGLWHGANWTFAAWGAWHGLLLVLHQSWPAWDRAVSVFWQRNVTFLLITLGWVFFRSPDFAHVGRWFSGLAGVHGVGTISTPETLTLLGLVVVCVGIVRLCPNSLELPLDRLGALPQAGLGAACAAAVVLMNYGSKFLYFQF